MSVLDKYSQRSANAPEPGRGQIVGIHVKADRDLTLGLALLGLLLYRRALPLALLVAAGTVAPVFDCALSLADPRGHVGYALAGHGSAVLYGLVTLWLLLWPAVRSA